MKSKKTSNDKRYLTIPSSMEKENRNENTRLHASELKDSISKEKVKELERELTKLKMTFISPETYRKTHNLLSYDNNQSKTNREHYKIDKKKITKYLSNQISNLKFKYEKLENKLEEKYYTVMKYTDTAVNMLESILKNEVPRKKNDKLINIMELLKKLKLSLEDQKIAKKSVDVATQVEDGTLQLKKYRI